MIKFVRYVVAYACAVHGMDCLAADLPQPVGSVEAYIYSEGVAHKVTEGGQIFDEFGSTHVTSTINGPFTSVQLGGEGVDYASGMASATYYWRVVPTTGLANASIKVNVSFSGGVNAMAWATKPATAPEGWTLQVSSYALTNEQVSLYTLGGATQFDGGVSNTRGWGAYGSSWVRPDFAAQTSSLDMAIQLAGNFSQNISFSVAANQIQAIDISAMLTLGMNPFHPHSPNFDSGLFKYGFAGSAWVDPVITIAPDQAGEYRIEALTPPAAVPEPSDTALVLAGLAAMGGFRRLARESNRPKL